MSNSRIRLCYGASALTLTLVTLRLISRFMNGLWFPLCKYIGKCTNVIHNSSELAVKCQQALIFDRRLNV